MYTTPEPGIWGGSGVSQVLLGPGFKLDVVGVDGGIRRVHKTAVPS